MKKKNPTWNRFNGMHSAGYSDNKRQRNFWRPPSLPIVDVKNSTEEKLSEEKSNDEPEQLEFNF